MSFGDCGEFSRVWGYLVRFCEFSCGEFREFSRVSASFREFPRVFASFREFSRVFVSFHEFS